MKYSFDLIHQVVDAFYEKAKTDILIGFQFNHIQDFDHHINHVSLFWEQQLLGSLSAIPEYPFNVPDAHLKLKINIGQLNRWIVLFHQTLDEIITNPKMNELWKNKIEFFKDIFVRKFLVTL